MGMVSYPGQKGKYPESTQAAKGQVDWTDDLADVRPTEEVARFHFERHLRDLKGTLERQGAKYAEVKVELAARLADLESANGFAKKPKGKTE